MSFESCCHGSPFDWAQDDKLTMTTHTMKQLFTRIGLNQKETKIFLTLLELGAQPVSVIGKRAGVPRTTMYTILEKLKGLGLIEEFERAGIQYYKCIPVDSLPDVLKRQESELHQTMELLNQNLPQLASLESTLSITPKVQFFEGKEEVKKMYLDVMRKEGKFDAFLDASYVKKMLPELHFELPKILQEEEGTSRELVVDNAAGKEYQKLFKTRHHQIKLLPKSMQFAADMIIARDTLYMTAYGKGVMSAVEIYSPELAAAQRVVFESVWNGA